MIKLFTSWASGSSPTGSCCLRSDDWAIVVDLVGDGGGSNFTTFELKPKGNGVHVSIWLLCALQYIGPIELVESYSVCLLLDGLAAIVNTTKQVVNNSIVLWKYGFPFFAKQH